MTNKRFLGVLTLMAIFAAPAVFAASDHVEGVINARSHETFTVTIAGGSDVTVVLTDTTKIRVNQAHIDASDLVPGLEVKVKGAYDPAGRLVADEVSLGHSELRMSGIVKGGLAPTKRQVEANTASIDAANARLDQHGAALDRHGEQIDRHAQQITANDMKMVATTGRLGDRIDNLDDYAVADTLIVYFANGKATVRPEFVTQLQEFAAKTRDRRGYRVQVQGYASAVGPRAFNEALSDQRADNVTALLQRAGVPPTAILVPAAMGISEQFAENKTAKGQAENRRVIVKLLQIKGITEK